MNIDLSNAQYTEIITALVATMLLVLGVSTSAKRSKLLKNGIKVEGTVFAFEKATSRSGIFQEATIFPVIRFVTIEKEWVTAKYFYGITPKYSLFGSSYKEGDRVPVIYNPEKVTDFMLDDFTGKVIGVLFIIIGTVVLIGSIIQFVS